MNVGAVREPPRVPRTTTVEYDQVAGMAKTNAEEKKPEVESGAIRYAAFLRGINVGGHRKIKMTDLARMFSDMGLADVRTVIASGNVVFSSDEANETELTKKIERALEQELGYPIDVMLRRVAWLQELIERDPFASVTGDEGHRYVSFMQSAPKETPDLPYDAPDEYYAVLALHDRDVFWLSRKMPNGRHGDTGKFISKHVGKVATVRNWNTVVKIAEM
jgi:uncharacterized protein (DUF1697 family)